MKKVSENPAPTSSNKRLAVRSFLDFLLFLLLLLFVCDSNAPLFILKREPQYSHCEMVDEIVFIELDEQAGHFIISSELILITVKIANNVDDNNPDNECFGKITFFGACIECEIFCFFLSSA